MWGLRFTIFPGQVFLEGDPIAKREAVCELVKRVVLCKDGFVSVQLKEGM